VVGADTSTIAAFLGGHSGSDVTVLRQALVSGELIVPPVVITELLSRPGITAAAISVFGELPRIAISDGYFERAGELRRKVRAKKVRARLADALIAQSCIDADVALITRDADFAHFAKHCGLKLA
jgi:predicted nucleic acid-binding protein